MPQGLEPPVKLTAKGAPKAGKPRAKPSKPAAKVAAKHAANPAGGEPIPLASTDHVELYKVKYHVKKSGTPSLLLNRLDMHPCTQFPG